LLKFFAVSSTAAWERQWRTEAVAFRQSSAFVASPQAVSAWLRIGELEAARVKCASFDAAKLERALPQIRQMTRSAVSMILDDLTKLLQDCGVALILTRELKGTHLSGATKWLSSDKVLLQLSLRHRRDDQFWFSLFHELGHILRGGKRQAYLDSADESGWRDQDEEEADQFARTQLIAEDDYRRLFLTPDLSREQVREFARQVGVSPGIVVGRLQRDGRIGPAEMNDLKKPIRFSNEAYK
jgi:Zn-dependent peptidase ImmA (M78 family)